MSAHPPLIVPMSVEALVVNDPFRTTGTNSFVRNQMDYNGMPKCMNGQPGISNNDRNFTLPGDTFVHTSGGQKITAGDYYNGVYLKWRLPKAFTHGVQNNVTSVTKYPPVPNRWLVVRYSGAVSARVASAWIVESDYLHKDDVDSKNETDTPSVYVKPVNDSPSGVFMGRNVALASGSWSESGTDLGLTAIAPGNPAFAFYQPQCNNVFSFVDCLNGQSEETLSYMVCGWFSNPEKDPLAPGDATVDLYPTANVAGAPTFSGASATKVAWSAGTVTAGTTAYQIAAGNTGDLTQQTYIYLDPGVSATVLQTTTTIVKAQAAGCALLAVATPFFLAQLAALGWDLPQDTDTSLTASWSLLYGTLNNVKWQNNEIPPGGAPKDPVSVAVGNSSIEALTAMISAQATAKKETVDSELLEAFQLDLLDVFDEPDGAAVLAEKLHTSFFQKHSSGYEWRIFDAADSPASISQQERQKEEVWLAKLNQDQAKLDAATLELSTLQRQLYEMWWKYESWEFSYLGSTSIKDLNDSSSLKSELDPTQSGSLAQQTASTAKEVSKLRAKIPDGDTPDALAQAIQDFVADKKLSASRVLKRTSKPNFHLANDPVLLIAGAGASGIVRNTDAITCRFPSQLVTGFKYASHIISSATQGLLIPQPDLSNVTGAPWSTSLVEELVDEFFFLDPGNATMVSDAVSSSSPAKVRDAMQAHENILPSYPVDTVSEWTKNPWHPLLMYWQASYYPIEYGTGRSPNWAFEDGRYVRKGTQTSYTGDVLTLDGTIQLTPTANYTFAARIRKLLQNDPDLGPHERTELKALLSFIEENDHSDVLSQALSGFNTQLLKRGAGVFMSPKSSSLDYTPSLSELIGDAAGYPPSVGNIPTTPPFPSSNFQSLRAGQFVFLQLVLIDEWGQALWPIDQYNYQNETIYMPADLTPVLTSNSMEFDVVSDPANESAARKDGNFPTIASLSPNALHAGYATSNEIPITVTGTGFEPGGVVYWNSQALPTEFVSSSSLVAKIPASFTFAPSTAEVKVVLVGGESSATKVFTVSAGAWITALSPDKVSAGSAVFELTVNGVGFEPESQVLWNDTPLGTTFVNERQLTAQVPAKSISATATIDVSVSVGTKVLPNTSDSLVQVPPALLQPARLNFDLISAADDSVVFGPANPGADPVCGWVLPNHLDGALMAYDAAGASLGEMSLAISATGEQEVCWTPVPGASFQTLAELSASIPHFGEFLETLAGQTVADFAAFLAAVDETLWTTAPMAASFDQSTAILMGRPLAMVRARLAFELNGAPISDPSWQYTFNPASPEITTYEFPIELGNLARLEDGLIGYFSKGQYGTFNVVTQSGASDTYLHPIGRDGNYIRLPFDGNTSAYLSMLVDPRAAVHATTGILPVTTLALPPEFVDYALAAMKVTFRVNGILTDQRVEASGDVTMLMPVPKEKDGTWAWLENDDGSWNTYKTAPNDTTARLSDVSPVLRRGFLSLSSDIDHENNGR